MWRKNETQFINKCCRKRRINEKRKEEKSKINNEVFLEQTQLVLKTILGHKPQG